MKQLSGHTKPYAVLGHPIGHTLSPVMHNASLQSLSLDAIYLAFDVSPQRLMGVLPAMRDMGFGGVNLTVPLKEVAFNHIDLLDSTAKKLGAVNTVAFTDSGELKGFNTDGIGFLLAVKEAFHCEVQDKDAFVLGTGGAGRALAITCAEAGVKHLSLTDIDENRTQKLVSEIQALFPSISVEGIPNDRTNWKEASLKSDLIIQATPIGMNKRDNPLLTKDAFRKGQMLFDLVYMYPNTNIMREAALGGAAVANGLGMLLHQGARAFEIWTGLKADVSAMRQALEKSVYGETL